MKIFYLLFVSLVLVISCSDERYVDKGNEFVILEDSRVTPFVAVQFETNESCNECHPIIYEEYMKSMHFKATVFRDPIHNAVWEDHPKFKDKTQYKCAQCHIPGAENIDQFMNEGGQAMPDEKSFTQNEAISCAACHKITSIEKHRQANRNIYSTKKDEYYGIREQLSIAHLSNSNNKMYRTGEMCMGCHSHRENIKKYIVCITEDSTKAKTYDTCISCHMPQVAGPSSTNSTQKKHFFHGFAGAHNNQEILAKHVLFSAEQLSDSEVKLRVVNKAAHDLFAHPLRKSFIKVSVIRKGKEIHQFEDIVMERIMKDEKGVAGCTLATRETASNIIKGDLTSLFYYEYDFQKGDQLKVEYGYHLVKAEMLKVLGLENNKEAKEYKIFKSELLTI